MRCGGSISIVTPIALLPCSASDASASPAKRREILSYPVVPPYPRWATVRDARAPAIRPRSSAEGGAAPPAASPDIAASGGREVNRGERQHVALAGEDGVIDAH